MTTRPLTPKQEAFVAEYLIDLNATKAAERAGYSKRTANEQGSRLLANVSVRSALVAAMEARSVKTGITADYVLETIQQTIERCKQAAPVLDRKGKPVMVEGPDGEYVPAYTFDSSSVLRGSELLMRHLGLFKKDQEQAGAAAGNAIGQLLGAMNKSSLPVVPNPE